MSLGSAISRPTCAVRRSALLVAGLLWLLSGPPTFGQDSPLASPAVVEPLADLKTSHAPSGDQRSKSIPLSVSYPSASHLMQTAVSTQKLGVPPAPNLIQPQVAGKQKTLSPVIVRSGESDGFHWSSALGQSFLFLGIEHGIRLAFDPPSRTALKGKFWDDYVASLHELGHWGDGNPAFINYLGHPLQGSVTGFIQIQNDPAGRSLQISWSREYRNSRLKALAWSAAYSTFFEIGFPLSEAALGNLGVDKSRQTQQGVVDLVITPTVGTAWLVGEDFLDRYVVARLERDRGGNSQKLIRTLLNPTRSFSNVLRFRYPWYRDSRP
jgi:hypothetical protein